METKQELRFVEKLPHCNKYETDCQDCGDPIDVYLFPGVKLADGLAGADYCRKCAMYHR